MVPSEGCPWLQEAGSRTAGVANEENYMNNRASMERGTNRGIRLSWSPHEPVKFGCWSG